MHAKYNRMHVTCYFNLECSTEVWYVRHIRSFNESLIPRPFRRRKKGLVHIAHACAGVSIVTGRVTMVIAHGFCMTCSSMDDKRRVYDSIRFPQFFLGSPSACACNVYQALSPPEGPGYEATSMRA